MKALPALLAIGILRADCISVSGDKILAGDFSRAFPAFAVADPARTIAFSPLPGTKRNMPAREIGVIARRLGLTLDPAALSDVCFERESHPLTAADLQQAIAAAIATPDARVEVLDYTRAALPAGHLEFRLSDVPYTPVSAPETPFIWRGRLVDEGNRSFAVWAQVRVIVRMPVLVAKAALVKGRVIEADQIEVKNDPRSPFIKGYLTALDQALGRAPKQNVPAGQPIRSAWLELPGDILQGETVRVEVISGQAQISFDAKAETGGRKGDTILVRNPKNGRTLRATVLEKGKVQVRS